MVSIDSISSSGDVAARQSQMQQIKADFDKLQQSLQSGDLSGAQQAFAALQKDGPQGTNNPLQSQIDALGQALQSGNLSAARQAFSSLQSAAKTQASPLGAGGSGSGGAGGAEGSGSGSSPSKTVVSTSTSTSASGEITTVTTYSNGTTETTISYGPPPSSTQSQLA